LILAFDTYYSEDKAKTVCIAFESWENENNFKIYHETIEDVDNYISGEFYKRELPCILSLLTIVGLDNIELIIVDGFVFLDDNNKFGLGAYLYQKLNKKIPVIGVAKRDFATINKNRKEVTRGKSENPLFVTSIGIDLDIASKKIKDMEGNYRMPTLLKKLDQLTRKK
jgi:exodeoxyribonuclease-5/deoxyribonuclease V